MPISNGGPVDGWGAAQDGRASFTAWGGCADEVEKLTRIFRKTTESSEERERESLTQTMATNLLSLLDFIELMSMNIVHSFLTVGGHIATLDVSLDATSH